MDETEPFALDDWYTSEVVRRNLGKICSAVFSQEKSVNLLGTRADPLLELSHFGVGPDAETVSIDEARADWSNVTLAAAVYGTCFYIQNRASTPSRVGLILATLRRKPQARHPVERYFRSPTVDAERLAQQIEALARDVRKLGQARG